MSVAWLVARLALAVVFAVAGVMKLVNVGASRKAVREFGVPQRLAAVLGTLLPLGELAVAGALLRSGSARWGAAGALVLLGAFIAAITVALAKGRKPDCHCFGQVRSRPVGVPTLARNLVLAGMAGLVGWHPTGNVSELALVGLAAAVAFALQGWFCFQLLRQNGRILMRLAEVEQSLANSTAPKLRSGAPAPYFSLPALSGSQITLESLLAPRRPLLLAFVDPGCGPCVALLPQLATWQRELAQTLTVAVVSKGDAAANEGQADRAGLELVLLQPGSALSELYGVHATPSAVLIDPQGQIAQPLATGPAAIAELIHSTSPAALELSLNGGVAAESHGAGINGNAPSSNVGTGAAAAVGAAATLLVAAGSMAPDAEAADPERAAILAKIRASEPHVVAHMRELQRATKHFAVLKPKPAARTAMVHAVSHARKDVSDLRQAIGFLHVSASAAVDAQGLVLASLKLLDQSYAKLEEAARTRNPGRSLRAVKVARKLFDQAQQRSVTAQAALTRP